MVASRLASMGQRKRRSRTTTTVTRLPMSAAEMPRRVVSSSGSSGMVQPPPEDSRGLLDLRFFVRDVLARHGIEFLGFHLVRMQPLVLRGRIEMTGTGGRDQLDFIAHADPP